MILLYTKSLYKTWERLLLQAVNDARIRGLWRRGIQSRARDKVQLLRAFCVTKFYQSIKEIEKAFDIDIRRGQSVPLLLFQFSSVTQSCATLCDPMNRSTPGLPVHHQLPEFTQTHVHGVGDSIQPSNLLSPSPPVPNPSQHQGLFQ